MNLLPSSALIYTDIELPSSQSPPVTAFLIHYRGSHVDVYRYRSCCKKVVCHTVHRSYALPDRVFLTVRIANGVFFDKLKILVGKQKPLNKRRTYNPSAYEMLHRHD